MINATYIGNSKYLIHGEEYMVTKSNRKNKVTVKLSYNKKLKMSNGGVEFSINTFEIEVEDKKKMVLLDDLTPEDKERLLLEAREIIEQENIEKNAIVMYTIKKKGYLESIINEVETELNIKEQKDKTYIGEKIKSLIYSLFRYDKYGNHYKGQKTNTISCTEEWNSFTRIGNIVKDAVIQSMKDDKS